MKTYRNSESGIAATEPGDSWIKVRYKTGKTFRYSTPPLSKSQIDTMKRYAESNDGLGTYINKNRDVYNAGKPV